MLRKNIERTPSPSEESRPIVLQPLDLRSVHVIRDAGIALLMVIIMVAIVGAAALEMSYNSRIELESAIGGRDALRAHYLNRSAMNIGQLMLRIQKQLLDDQLKAMKMDIQISDYASFLMQAFNHKESASMLGGMLGAESDEIKGLGIAYGEFDLEMESLDGKVNLNCGGGSNPGAPQVARLAQTLMSLFAPQKFNNIFEYAGEDGEFSDRITTVQSIIDWVDLDQSAYGSGNAEDYRYPEQGYATKNQYFDTIEELKLVQGITPYFHDIFADQFTVYGGCKTNLNLISVPIIHSLILQYAADQSDPGLLSPNSMLLAYYVKEIGTMTGGFQTPKQFASIVANPVSQMQRVMALQSASLGDTDFDDKDSEENAAKQNALQQLQQVIGVKLDQKKLAAGVVGMGPRRIWKLTAKATVGKVRRKIVAVWDQNLISSLASKSRRRSGRVPSGGLIYWRDN